MRVCVCVCALFHFHFLSLLLCSLKSCASCCRRRRFFLGGGDVSILPFSSQISQQDLPKHYNAEEYGCDFLLLLSFDAKDRSSRVCFFSVRGILCKQEWQEAQL